MKLEAMVIKAQSAKKKKIIKDKKPIDRKLF
jgi:hypothetical protein